MSDNWMELNNISWIYMAKMPYNFWMISSKNGHFGSPRHIYKDASNFDAGDTHFDRLIIMELVITQFCLNLVKGGYF